ncbi:hypothetical protein B0H14DRAFT_2841504 [Mycena olivaceomarginata]|nr:hypothetical protein B0H14DRAFT_2841504 [Mycena olivaceomarginata]
MVAFDNLMHQMARESSFSGFWFFGAKSTFRVPHHSCARAFSGTPLAPPQMRWVSPHALRVAPCDAAVVRAAPQRLRICVLPRSVDADVRGAPALFLDWGAHRTCLRTYPARTPGTEHELLGTAKTAPLNVAPEPTRFQSSASSTCSVHTRCSSPSCFRSRSHLPPSKHSSATHHDVTVSEVDPALEQ